MTRHKDDLLEKINIDSLNKYIQSEHNFFGNGRIDRRHNVYT